MTTAIETPEQELTYQKCIDGRRRLLPKPPTREECLQRRVEASKKIAELRKRHEPLIVRAAAELADADRQLSAAKIVLAETEAKQRDAYQSHNAAIHVRDSAIGEQERVIAKNPDPQIRELVASLEAEQYEVRSRETCENRNKKYLDRLQRAIESARKLECDPGIMSSVKLDAALAGLAISRLG